MPATFPHPHAHLLPGLKALLSLPPDPCPRCDSGERHDRCARCRSCFPLGTYKGGPCPACGACPTRYYRPVQEWTEQKPWAATVAAEMINRIRRGWDLSPRHVALCERIIREGGRKPTSAERDALSWITPKSQAWRPILALVKRDAPLVGEAYEAMDVNVYHADYVREITASVITACRTILGERTGYEVLPNLATYHDAMKAVGTVLPSRCRKPRSADPVLENVIVALCELHAWLVIEKRIVEVEAA